MNRKELEKQAQTEMIKGNYDDAALLWLEALRLPKEKGCLANKYIVDNTIECLKESKNKIN